MLASAVRLFRARAASARATVYGRHYERTGDLAALRTAARDASEAVRLLPDGHPDLPVCQFMLCTALSDLFDHEPDPDSPRRAVRAGRAGVAALPAGHRPPPRA
jgi:hypothetical protein